MPLWFQNLYTDRVYFALLRYDSGCAHLGTCCLGPNRSIESCKEGL